MAANVEQLLSAVLADLDRVHTELVEVTGRLGQVEEHLTNATDVLEASRVSLGALRNTVREQ